MSSPELKTSQASCQPKHKRKNQTTHSGHSIGRWMNVQRKIKRRAHIASSIGIHVDVCQRCRAHDVESPALPAMSTRNVPAGRWIKGLGKGRRRGAHPSRSLIRVDVGVGQRRRAKHSKSSTLPGEASARNVSSGRWNVTHGFNSREGLPPAKTHTEQLCQCFSGAMDETSGKVQRCKHTASAVLS